MLKKARFSSSNLSSSATLTAFNVSIIPAAAFETARSLSLVLVVPLVIHAGTSRPKQYPTRDIAKAYSGSDGESFVTNMVWSWTVQYDRNDLYDELTRPL